MADNTLQSEVGSLKESISDKKQQLNQYDGDSYYTGSSFSIPTGGFVEGDEKFQPKMKSDLSFGNVQQALMDNRADLEKWYETTGKWSVRFADGLVSKMGVGAGQLIGAAMPFVDMDAYNRGYKAAGADASEAAKVGMAQLYATIDNKIVNYFEEHEKTVDKSNPIYQTLSSEYASLTPLQKSFTGEFWATEGSDALEFMAAAMIGTKGLGAGLGAVNAGARAATGMSKVADAAKQFGRYSKTLWGGAEAGEAAARGLNLTSAAAKAEYWANLGTSAFIESGFEARGVLQDVQRNLKSINENTSRILEADPAMAGVTSPDQLAKLAKERGLPYYTEQDINGKAGKAAAGTMMWNMLVLLPSETVTLGKMIKSYEGTKALADLTKKASPLRSAIKGGLESAVVESQQENVQLGIQNYFTDHATEESKGIARDQGAVLGGILWNSLNNFGTDEGQISMGLGAAMGTPFGVYSSRQEAVAQNEYNSKVNQIMQGNLASFGAKLDDFIPKVDGKPQYKFAKDGSIDWANTFDQNMVNDKAQAFANAKLWDAMADQAASKENKEAFEYLQDLRLASFAYDHINTFGNKDYLEEQVTKLAEADYKDGNSDIFKDATGRTMELSEVQQQYKNKLNEFSKIYDNVEGRYSAKIDQALPKAKSQEEAILREQYLSNIKKSQYQEAVRQQFLTNSVHKATAAYGVASAKYNEKKNALQQTVDSYIPGEEEINLRAAKLATEANIKQDASSESVAHTLESMRVDAERSLKQERSDNNKKLLEGTEEYKDMKTKDEIRAQAAEALAESIKDFSTLVNDKEQVKAYKELLNIAKQEQTTHEENKAANEAENGLKKDVSDIVEYDVDGTVKRGRITNKYEDEGNLEIQPLDDKGMPTGELVTMPDTDDIKVSEKKFSEGMLPSKDVSDITNVDELPTDRQQSNALYYEKGIQSSHDTISNLSQKEKGQELIEQTKYGWQPTKRSMPRNKEYDQWISGKDTQVKGATAAFEIDLDNELWNTDPILNTFAKRINSGKLSKEAIQAELFKEVQSSKGSFDKLVVDRVPIKMAVTTKEGKTFKGQLYYHTPNAALRDNLPNPEVARQTTRDNRVTILTSLLLGNEVTSTITDTTSGILNIRPVVNPISILANDKHAPKIFISDRSGNIYGDKEGIDIAPFTTQTSGAIFVTTTNTPQGKEQKVRANVNALAEEDAYILFEALNQYYAFHNKARARGVFDTTKVAHDNTKSILEKYPVTEGTTLGSVINNITVMGERATTAAGNKKFYVKWEPITKQDQKSTWVLYYGSTRTALYPGSTVAKEALRKDFVRWATENKNYNVVFQDAHTGIGINKVIAKDLNIGTLQFKAGKSYNDTVFDKMNINVDIYEGTGSVYGSPSAILATNGNDLALTTKLSSKQLKINAKENPVVIENKVITADTKKPIAHREFFGNSAADIEAFKALPRGTKIYRAEAALQPNDNTSKGIKEWEAKYKTLYTGKKSIDPALTYNAKVATEEGTVTEARPVWSIEPIGEIVLGIDGQKQFKNTSSMTLAGFGMFYPGVDISRINLTPSKSETAEGAELKANAYLGNLLNKYSNPNEAEFKRIYVEYPTVAVQEPKQVVADTPVKVVEAQVQDDELASQQVVDLATKIAKGEPAISPEELQIQANNAAQLEEELKRLAEEKVAYEESIPEVTKDTAVNIQTLEDVQKEMLRELGLEGFAKTKTDKAFTKADVEKETRWLFEKLGLKLGADVRVDNELLAQMSKGRKLFGLFHRDMIVLAKEFEAGTAYHEAFHRVSQLHLDSLERNLIYEEARTKYAKELQVQYGKKGYYSDLEVEELLADQFQAFVLSKVDKVPTTITGKIGKFFANLWQYIKNFILRKDPLSNTDIEHLFKAIERGGYKNAKPIYKNYQWLDQTTLGKRIVDGVEFEHLNNYTEYLHLVKSLVATTLAVHNIGVVEDVEFLDFNKLKIFIEKTIDRYAALPGQENKVGLLKEVISNWNIIQPRVKQLLTDYKIKVSSDNIENKENSDESVIAWDRSPMEIDVKEGMIAKVKFLVASLSTGQFDPKTGLIEAVDTNAVWKSFLYNLHGIDTLEELDNILVEKSTTDPIYKALKQRLDKGTTDMKLAFLTSVRTHRHKYVTAFITAMTRGKGDIATSTEYGLTRSSFQNEVSMLVNKDGGKWGNYLYQSSLTAKGKVSTIDKTKYLALVSTYDKLRAKAISKDGLLDPYQMLNDIIKLLNDTMIPIDLATIEHVISKQYPNDIKTGIQQFLSGRNNDFGISKLYTQDSTLWKLAHHDVSTGAMTQEGKGGTYEIGVKQAFNNEKQIRQLANAFVEIHEDTHSDQEMGPDFSPFYRYSPNNFISDFFRYMGKEDGLLAGVQQSAYGKGSLWAKQFKEGAKAEISTLLNFLEDKSNDSGRQFVDLNDLEDIMLKMLCTMNNKMVLPTLADKKPYYTIDGLIRIPTILSSTEVGTYGADALNAFMQYARDERDRVELTIKQIEAAKRPDGTYDTLNLVENLHYIVGKNNDIVVVNADGKYVGNGTKYHTFTDFNTISADQFEARLKEVVSKQLDAKVQSTIQYLDKIGIIEATKDKDGRYSVSMNKLIPINLINQIKKDKEYGENTSGQFIAEDIIADFAINNMSSIIEVEKLLSGDPALYKSGGKFSRVYEDMIKRLSALTSTGNNLGEEVDYNGEHLGKSYTVASMYSNKRVQSVWYKELLNKYVRDYKEQGMSDAEARDTAKADLSKFHGDIDNTDAQVLITPAFFRQVGIRLGEWNPMRQAALEALEGDIDMTMESKKAAMELVMEPLKMMYFGHEYSNGNDIVTYDKMSLATLFKQVVKGTQLEPLYNEMKGRGIDMVKFDTSVKAGNRNRITFFGDKQITPNDYSNLTVYNQSFRWLRRQMPTTPHEDERSKAGTQFIKIILANINDVDTFTLPNGTNINGTQVKRNIVSALSHISTLGRDKILGRLGVDPKNISKVDLKKLYEALQDEASKGNMSDDFISSLSFTDGKPDVEIDAFTQRSFIYNRMLTMVTKSTIDLELPGGPLIQQSNIGMREIGLPTGVHSLGELKEFVKTDSKQDLSLGISADQAIYNSIIKSYSDDLKFYTTDDKQMYSMEGIVSVRMFKDVIPGYRTNTHEQNEKIVLEQMPELIGYRIPTQGLSSVVTIKIARVLPESAGDVIILPTEFTALTGSDFDIDKLYAIRHNFERTGKAGMRKVEFMQIADAEREVLSEIEMGAITIEDATKKLRGINSFSNRYNAKFREVSSANMALIDEDLSEKLKTIGIDIKAIDEAKKGLRSDIDILLEEKTRLQQADLKGATPNDLEARRNRLNEIEYRYKDLTDKYVQALDTTAYLINANREARKLLLPYFIKAGLFQSELDFLKLPEVQQNTQAAVENFLVDNFMARMHNSKDFTQITKPIEGLNAKIKSEISNKVNKAKEVDGIERLTPEYQSMVKFQFISAKKDLGAAALNNVHHSFAQLVDLGLQGIDSKIPVLTTDGVAQLHRQKGNDGVYIHDWLSALINGFVDVAKDPYIVYTNINSTTSNVAYLLLRLGIGEDTFKFMAQPILFDMTARERNKNGRITTVDRKSNSMKAIRSEWDTRLKNALAAEKKPTNYYQDYVFNPFNISTDMAKMNEYLSIFQDIDNKSSEFYFNQLQVLDIYESLNKPAQLLFDAVRASQIDTKKFGSNIYEVKAFDRLLRRTLSNPQLVNFDKIVDLKGVHEDATHLGPLYNNSIETVFKLYKNISIVTSPGFESMVEMLELYTGHAGTTKADLMSKLYKEMFTTVLAQYFNEHVGKSHEDVKAMFYGSNSIANRTFNILQSHKDLQDNDFLNPNWMYQKFSTEDNKADFLSTSVQRDRIRLDDLAKSEAFKDLLYDSREDVRTLANDLLVYAFYSSGMDRTLYSISEYLPTKYLANHRFTPNGMTINEFIQSKLSEFSTGYGVTRPSHAVLRAIKANWYSDDFVKSAPSIISIKTAEKEGAYKYATIANIPTKINRKGEVTYTEIGRNELNQPLYIPYYKVKEPFGNTILYKFVGSTAMGPVYVAVDKLGYYDKGYHIKEHGLSKTIVPTNILPVSIELSEKAIRNVLDDDTFIYISDRDQMVAFNAMKSEIDTDTSLDEGSVLESPETGLKTDNLSTAAETLTPEQIQDRIKKCKL